ncbi:MAG: VWA domain-containing protein [Thermodesulfobacteriota bacterium]
MASQSLVDLVIAFAGLLRQHGFSASPPSVMDALSGLTLVGIRDPADVRTVLRASFMTRIEEQEAFERLFRQFWFPGETGPGDQAVSAAQSPSDVPSHVGATLQILTAGERDTVTTGEEVPRSLVWYSPQESLREADLTALSLEPPERITRLIREIVRPLVSRLGAKRRRALFGTDLDFRRLFRKSTQHGGDILALPGLKPRPRIKKLVFLCDVSGSMNPYLSFMLRFVAEIQSLPTRVETFVFATRLTRITPLLAGKPFERALTEIGRTVKDWSGGTRMGECLAQLNALHGRSLLGPSTAVIIHSDGWDRGDTSLLTREMERLHRRAYRVLWINPLLGSPSYEPTCRGMKTALEHLDFFLPGYQPAGGLERLARTLGKLV